MDKFFELKIEMGNDQMRNLSHVATALITVYREMTLTKRRKGKIFDVNGNSVGSFGFKSQDK